MLDGFCSFTLGAWDECQGIQSEPDIWHITEDDFVSYPQKYSLTIKSKVKFQLFGFVIKKKKHEKNKKYR